MATDNIEPGLILRNTETASRDARAALDATERVAASVSPRLSAKGFQSQDARDAT